MTVIRAQVTIEKDSNLPADAVQNVWHFGTADPVTSSVLDDIEGALTAAYGQIDAWLSTYLDVAAEISYYDLADPSPRVPLRTDPLTLTLGSGGALPSQVAVVGSYHAAPESGSPAARRRGRLYFGPLDSDAMAAGSNDTLVSTTCVAAINAGLKAVADFSYSTNTTWVVFSPTSAGAPPWSEGVLDASAWTVVGGYCDNAFDIQRRRRVDPTTRTTWTAA